MVPIRCCDYLILPAELDKIPFIFHSKPVERTVTSLRSPPMALQFVRSYLPGIWGVGLGLVEIDRRGFFWDS